MEKRILVREVLEVSIEIYRSNHVEGKEKKKEGQPGLEIGNNWHRQQHRQVLEGGER